MNIWWNKIIYNLGHISSLTDGNGGITKWLWFYIKKQRKDNFGVASLKHDNVYNDNQMKAELLNNYFTSVFTPHSSEPPPIISDTSFPDITTISVQISMESSTYPFSETMCYWSGSYFDTYISSTYPSIQYSTWLKQANIVPIFKKVPQQ